MGAIGKTRLRGASEDTKPSEGYVLLTDSVGVAGVGRAVRIVCTTAGTVTLTAYDGSTCVLVLPAAGIYEFNDAVQQFAGSSGFAGSVYNLI